MRSEVEARIGRGMILTLMFVGQLDERIGQIATPVETHDLRFHIAGLVFV